MLVLRELDLELAFERRGTLREDVEDQPVAIEHARLESNLEIALLAGLERLIDQNELGVGRARSVSDLLDLAAADEVLRIGPVPTRLNLGDDLRAGGFRECAELLGLVFVTGTVQADMEQ